MTIPDYQSMMLPVLKSAKTGEANISEVIDQLADGLHLTEDERSELLPSGRQTVFSNRVHWAKTYLSKANLLESTRRAHFAITDCGREVLSRHPERIDKEYLSEFPEFIEFLNRRRPPIERPDRADREDNFASDDRTTGTGHHSPWRRRTV